MVVPGNPAENWFYDQGGETLTSRAEKLRFKEGRMVTRVVGLSCRAIPKPQAILLVAFWSIFRNIVNLKVR